MGTEKPSEMSWATLTVSAQELEKQILLAIAITPSKEVQLGRIEQMITLKQELDREILFRLANNDIAPHSKFTATSKAEVRVRDFGVKDIFAVIEPRGAVNPAGIEFVILSRHDTYEEAVTEATKAAKVNKNYAYVARLLSIVEMK